MPDELEDVTIDTPSGEGAVDTDTGEILEELEEEADLSGWVWEAMEPPVRRERLAELRTWVHWLVRTYPRARTHLTPCWYEHRDVRDILTALFVSWVRVYSPGAKRDTAEADWITTMLRMLPELTLKECSAAKHTPPVEREFNDHDRVFELHAKTSDQMVAPARHPGRHEMIRQGVEE